MGVITFVHCIIIAYFIPPSKTTQMASAANNTSNENVDEVAAAQTESDSIHSGSETAPNSNHRTDPPEGEGPEVEDVGNGPVAVSTAGPRVVQVQGLPLEWTQMGNNSAAEQQQQPVIRYPCDVMAMEAMDPTDTELCIVGTAGQKITHMGPTFFETTPNPASLTSLILRSHVIRKIEGLQGFINLELLELYDNQVDSLSTCFFPMDDGGCCPGRTLKILDMSYNSIRDMDPVAFCPNLQELCTLLLV